ncbi:hypothetical protein ONE63_008214 [Megalurothrips usitatus]|uniref:Uncharacterized protein n=1 Tax=Megalurothrips usitatus TaxID=439358 RepID=A0AAV7XQ76_9NEOP|nr:hypothetical protein ONE63_008214 [Megalurothrips usitatus]
MSAARIAALERSSKEALRAAELDRQAARDQAREAREAAEKEKRAMLEASRKLAEDVRREHEEALAALRNDMKAVRDECAEEVNVAALEFEERSAQLTDRISSLEAENLSLREQLSASTEHIGYLESRLSELRHAQEAEKNRLMELNRVLMLQQQQQQNLTAAAAAPAARLPRGRGPRAPRPRAPAAAPRFQPASAVYAPASAAPGAATYPVLQMSWRRGGASVEAVAAHANVSQNRAR